jgi:type I restriction enzyme R subunit
LRQNSGWVDRNAEIINAENSDLFDVLAYAAFALHPETRAHRAAQAKSEIHIHFNDKQEAFLDFVLAQYVKEGVEELDQEKLSPLLMAEVQQCDFGRDGGFG